MDFLGQLLSSGTEIGKALLTGKTGNQSATDVNRQVQDALAAERARTASSGLGGNTLLIIGGVILLVIGLVFAFRK